MSIQNPEWIKIILEINEKKPVLEASMKTDEQNDPS